ncbi:MAG: PDZ domain-containing protein [Chloroflexi bacterium]|nr:PDZ domain-containing protein [Chloroflexota bacterium]
MKINTNSHRQYRLFPLLGILLLVSLACSASSLTDLLERETPPTRMPVVTAAPTLPPQAADNVERQLEIFEDLWTVVNEEYVYQDFNGVDWAATKVEYQALIEAGLTADEFYVTLDEMIFSLGDEHSVYLSPELVAEEDAEFAGAFEYVGIGVYMQAVPERERALVLLVFPGTPAEAAGLKSRDSVLLVDGEPAIGADGFISEAIRGEAGSSVTLTVQTPGEEPREIIVSREALNVATPVPYEVLTSPAGQRIGYVLFASFADSTVDEALGEALRAMTADGPLDGLILDNRWNEGGYFDVLSNVLGYFMPDGTVGHFVSRYDQNEFDIRAEDINGSQGLPLVVMVGPGTVSAGEIMGGVLADFDRAYVIGETTFGNVESLSGYDFEDGSRAWIARETFRAFNNPDANWEDTGIIPDLTVTGNIDEFTLQDDPAVVAALEYFDN